MDFFAWIANGFLSILDLILGPVSQLIHFLNPCPFPHIIDSLTFSPNDPMVRAWGWISAFVDVPFLITITETFLLVFGVAWGIMLLWKWIKAR